MFSQMSPLVLQPAVELDSSVQITQLLEFCAAAFEDFHTEADILKGSRGQEERALALLKAFGGDVMRATYAVMHPCEHILEVEPPADLVQRVQQATSEFFMSKQADKDIVLQLLREALQRGTSEQELSSLIASAKAAKVPVPSDVTERLREAKAMAKTVAKRLTTKTVTWAEVEGFEAQLCALPVSTLTSQQLNAHANHARAWRSKLQGEPVDQFTLGILKELLAEAQALPFSMIELPELKNRYRKLKKCSEAYATLLRQLQKGDHGGTLEDALEVIEAMVQANQPLPDHSLVQAHVEAAISWRERVNMIGEDPKEVDTVLQVLEEGAELLLEPADISVQPGCAELLIKAENMRGQLIDLKELQDLVSQAEEKGLKAPILDEFQVLLAQTLELRQQAKTVLNTSNVEVETLQDLKDRILNLKTAKSLASFVQKLNSRLQRAKAWKSQVQALKESDDWTLKQLSYLSREQEKIKVTCPEYVALQQEANNAQKWLEDTATFLSLFPRDKHEAGEVERMRRLINSAPSLVQESSEIDELAELASASEAWKEKLPMLYANHEPSALEEALSDAKTLPASPQTVHDLEEKLKLWNWEVAVEACLAGEPNIKVLRELKQQAESNEQRRMPIYRSLQQALRLAEDWYRSFSASSWSIAKLTELYKSAGDNAVLAQERSHIKWTLEICSMWQWRAQKFLEEGGSYAELSTLLLEASSLHPSDELETSLKKVRLTVNAWRREAKMVLREAANPELAPLPTPRPLKRTLVELEYSLQPKTDDLVEDLLDAAESASCICMPSYTVVAAVPHPLQGLSLVYRKPKVRTALARKNRTAKSIRNDRRVLKEKLFSDLKPEYCICRRELSFDGFMIECDGCGEWFHPSCLGIEAEDAGRDGFECKICALRVNPELQLSEATFELPYFNDLFSQGKALQVKPPELHSFEVLARRIAKWLEAANNVLAQRDALETSFLSDLSYDAILATLLLEQDGLPIKLQATPSLLQLLRRRDLARITPAVAAVGSSKTVTRLLKNMSKTDKDSQAATYALKKKKEDLELWDSEFLRLQLEDSAPEAFLHLSQLSHEKALGLRKQIKNFEAARKRAESQVVELSRYPWRIMCSCKRDKGVGWMYCRKCAVWRHLGCQPCCKPN